jgi:hypothetical protein
MTPTALIVTPCPDRGRACRTAFLRSGYLPVIVGTVHEAIRLLRQFRTDLIVIHTPNNAGIDAPSRDRLTRAAGPTRIITTSELATISVPPPS